MALISHGDNLKAKLRMDSTSYWTVRPQIVKERLFQIMARKRKIPARKHHGVRDPLKQLEQKVKTLKNVINNPPDRVNDQKASFKFIQFKKLADDAKAGKKIKKIQSGKEDKPTNAKLSGKNKIRNIQQLHDETDRDYLRRVNRITNQSMKEAQYEAKYGVTVVRNPATGEITLKKKPKNEIDELLKQKQKERLNSKRGSKITKAKQTSLPLNPTVTKELVKQTIKRLKEEEKAKSTATEEYKRDVFKFGEIVHSPPTLTMPRHAEKCETVPRPGRKPNLLLKSLLSEQEAEKKVKTVRNKRTVAEYAVTKAQLQGKRKNLPLATRRMLETEQSVLVDLYRTLKKSKEKTK